MFCSRCCAPRRAPHLRQPGHHRTSADRRARRSRRPATCTTCSPCRRQPRSAWPTGTRRRPAVPRSSTCTRRPASATPSATSPTRRPTARRSSSPPASRTGATLSPIRCSSGDLVGLAARSQQVDARGAQRQRARHRAAPRVPRRAAPPPGPVFVSMPMDMLDDEAGDGTVPALPARSTIRRRAVAEGIDELAALLGGTRWRSSPATR